MNMTYSRAAGTALSILGLLVTGCSTSAGWPSVTGGSTVDMREVAQNADELIRQTFSAVKPPIEWTHDTSDHGPCDGQAGRLGDVTRRAVVMTKVSDARRGALLGVIERYWRSKGHRITDVDGDREFPSMYADSSDGFLKMGLVVGGKGQFFLDVQTACVKTSDVPEPPAAQGNGPSYYGRPIPRPNVESPFWSSEAPITSPST